ncbi:MAG: Xaa-Pro peptidase family protein [bacterium]|nr:Xaa-Pro peptidase family protein [bacterium]
MSTIIGQRISQIQRKLVKEKLDGLLVTNPVNMFYLFGLAEEECFALIGRKKSLLYVSVLNYPEVRHLVKAHRLSIISNKVSITAYLGALAAGKIGFESNNLTVNSLSVWKKLLRQAKLVPTTGFVEELRLIKDQNEIILVRHVAGVADTVYQQIKSLIKPGFSEQFIARKIDALIREKGCEPAFRTIVASGPGTAVPHHAVSRRKVQKNDIVMLDFGAIYKGYRSDLTRTIFLGKINKLSQYLYNVVYEAQTRAIKEVGPGKETQSIDRVARSIIAKAGYGRYFIHTTGHGLGLETHESPRLSSKDKVILQPGMVVTVEPGIYITGHGGIRIEDMVLVTKNGHEVLTKADK